MNNQAAERAPWSFWMIGAVALIWYLMGIMNFFMQMDAEMVASMPETHRAIIEGRPAWATAGFALGVIGGAIGCLLLLLKKSASYYVFIASLVGVIVTTIHALGIARSGVHFSPFEVGMMFVSSPVVAALLIWYAKRSESKGWIR